MQKDYPLVTCVTTTYKKFNYIYETLDSIFLQDYPNIEIILGDDGSPDFPCQDIKEYIEKNKSQNIKNYRILHEEENHGTVWNCANCRKHAAGTYIFGIASDDRFYDNKVISDVVACFQRTGAEIIVCKRKFVNAGNGKPMATMPFRNQIRWMRKLDNRKLFQKLSSYCFLTGANTYYKTSFYNYMGGYDTAYKYMEDYPFFLKLLRTNAKFYIFDRISIWYRYGAGVSTSPHNKNKFRTGMYEDRKRYMKKEIMPYLEEFPYFRKRQMQVRLKRFEMDSEFHNQGRILGYLKLFFYSPIGTIVQAWYQGSYKIKLHICK